MAPSCSRNRTARSPATPPEYRAASASRGRGSAGRAPVPRARPDTPGTPAAAGSPAAPSRPTALPSTAAARSSPVTRRNTENPASAPASRKACRAPCTCRSASSSDPPAASLWLRLDEQIADGRAARAVRARKRAWPFEAGEFLIGWRVVRKVLQHALFDQRNRLAEHAFQIERIVARQRLARSTWSASDRRSRRSTPAESASRSWFRTRWGGNSPARPGSASGFRGTSSCRPATAPAAAPPPAAQTASGPESPSPAGAFASA